MFLILKDHVINPRQILYIQRWIVDNPDYVPTIDGVCGGTGPEVSPTLEKGVIVWLNGRQDPIRDKASFEFAVCRLNNLEM